MPRTLPLNSATYRLAADLYGNPLPLERIQRSHRHAEGSRRPDTSAQSFRPTRPFDLPSRGGSSLTHAVSEQLELEARDRAFLSRLQPSISAPNLKMLEGLFLDNLSLDDIADREGCTRQAVSQRLARLCAKFPTLAERWRQRRHHESSTRVCPSAAE